MDFQEGTRCLDLTYLGDPQRRSELDPYLDWASLNPTIAAFCTWPHWISEVRAHLSHTSIHYAAVINFPQGTDSIEVIREQIALAQAQGADELDIVLPYSTVLSATSFKPLVNWLEQVQSAAASTPLKLILETAAFLPEHAERLQDVASLALEQGICFLKTSTGKYRQGATPQAATILLNTLDTFYQKTGERRGLKLSGGIKQLSDLNPFESLLQEYNWPITPSFFRIGSSQWFNQLATVQPPIY